MPLGGHEIASQRKGISQLYVRLGLKMCRLHSPDHPKCRDRGWRRWVLQSLGRRRESTKSDQFRMYELQSRNDNYRK